MLRVEGLSRRFGGLIACDEIRFSVMPREVFGIIGPNGAGKTTLFNVISGRFKPSAGRVTFEGRDVTGLSSDKIGRTGIGRTFQGVHMFREATVRENLRNAEVIARRHDPVAYLMRRKTSRNVGYDAICEAVGLTSHLDIVAGNLSYGVQKMLGIAMALVTSPKLLLMDEPVAGLNPSEKKSAGLLIRRLRDEFGITILLVEHDMPLVMSVCDRILVVSQGKPIALGTPAEIRAHPHVIDAYLGEDYEFA